MMQCTSAWYLFFVGILFSFIHTGTCYKCYTCAGAISAPSHESKIPLPAGIPLISTCVDPVDTRNLPTTECSEAHMACVKFTSDLRGVKVVLRGCFNPSDCKAPDECYHCRDDLCNSSTNVFPSWIVISITSLIYFKCLL